MNTKSFALLFASVIAVGCTADVSEPAAPAPEQTADDIALTTSFYGLTVMDCQAQATQCFISNSGIRLFRRPINCSAQLTKCLASASVEVASEVVDAAADVTECGTDGVSCFVDARRLSDVRACEAAVETCVVDKVDELTGIALPTSQEIIDTTLGTAGVVIETATGVVGEVVETTTEVVGEVAETATEVVATTVDTATTVVSETVETATEVVAPVVDTAVGIVDCSAESQKCWRTTRDFFGCQRQYNACLRSL
jgi:hypothetical protein